MLVHKTTKAQAAEDWDPSGQNIVVLSMTTLIFGHQALHLFLRPPIPCPSQVFGAGFSIEWDRGSRPSKACRCWRVRGPAKASIRLQEVTYTSAFRYNNTSKSYYRESDPASPQYVAAPSRDIDKAWGELLSGIALFWNCHSNLTWSQGQYLVLSQDEAQELENPVAINGAYLAE